MSGVSSSPRGERAGKPGAAWEQQLVRVEVVVEDDEPVPIPNRAARRAAARANHRKGNR